MKLGDFTQLAKSYIHRTGYSLEVLKALYRYAQIEPKKAQVADVGAGTGKLTENLVELGFQGYAIEPNSAMRCEGEKQVNPSAFEWIEGSGEGTSLSNGSVDWVLMGSSFHWPDTKKALREFYRILKPGGFFTAIWNPRDLSASPWHQEVEEKIKEFVPHLKRVSSGVSSFTARLEEILVEGGLFANPIYMEAKYFVEMSRERYLGAWRSVNDIRAQAGEEVFAQILSYLEEKTASLKTIDVPYKTRAWIVQSTK